MGWLVGGWLVGWGEGLCWMPMIICMGKDENSIYSYVHDLYNIPGNRSWLVVVGGRPRCRSIQSHWHGTTTTAECVAILYLACTVCSQHNCGDFNSEVSIQFWSTCVAFILPSWKSIPASIHAATAACSSSKRNHQTINSRRCYPSFVFVCCRIALITIHQVPFLCVFIPAPQEEDRPSCKFSIAILH